MPPAPSCLPLLLAAVLALVADPALAQQPREGLRAGMKELTLAGGYTTSHDIPSGAGPTVRSVLVMPHLGYVLTDPLGSGPLKGNLEVVGEPFVQLFTDPDDRAAVGASALLRWIFATGTSVLPYVEGGVGIMGGDLDLRQTNCGVNFVLEGGAGGLVFLGERWALTGGYRFQHVSNANICSRNLGINSSLFTLGVSYFFP